jgi:hypothetical protein
MASAYLCRFQWEGATYWHECGLEPDHPTRFHRCHCGSGHATKAHDIPPPKAACHWEYSSKSDRWNLILADEIHEPLIIGFIESEMLAIKNRKIVEPLIAERFIILPPEEAWS